MAQEELKPKVIFFLGAGASIPAGISGVVGLVEDFKRWLQQEGRSDYLDIIDKILEVILKKSRNSHDVNKSQADIEQLLDITERLENSDKEILLDFCKDKSSILSTSIGYHLISNGKKLLSNEIKRFIKISFTDRELNLDYIQPLMGFIERHRPLHIFSTNYDICIERFCDMNDKKFVASRRLC